MSRSLCNFIGQKGTISPINDLFVLNWGKKGQMVRENIILLTNIKKILAQSTYFTNDRL